MISTEKLSRFAVVSVIAAAAFGAAPAAAESQLGTKRFIDTLQQPRETVTKPNKPAKAIKQESAIVGSVGSDGGTFTVPRSDLDRLYQGEGYRLGR